MKYMWLLYPAGLILWLITGAWMWLVVPFVYPATYWGYYILKGLGGAAVDWYRYLVSRRYK